MMKCRLCKKADANQTGSHITSCFMVNSLLGDRDKEEGFIISSRGGDFTINRKADFLKDDFIFCRGCESRLSYLEGYFSSEFTNKIDEVQYSANFPVISEGNTNVCQPTNINPLAFHLLIYSVLWRAHISNNPFFTKYKIPEEVAESIRLTLDTVLPPYQNFKVKGKYKEWISELDSVKDLIKFYPYVILKTEWVGQDRTQNLIYFSDIENSPYHHLINEFVILAFFNNHGMDFVKQDYFELSEKYNLHYALNSKIDDLKIGVLRLADWQYIRDKFYGIVSEQLKMQSIVRDCIKIALSRGFLPTRNYMNYCIECRKNQ